MRGGPGSSKGSVPPVTPKAKGNKVNADEDNAELEEDDDGEPEDDTAGFDEELKQLEAMEAQAGNSASKKRGRPKSEAANTKKKSKKSDN